MPSLYSIYIIMSIDHYLNRIAETIEAEYQKLCGPSLTSDEVIEIFGNLGVIWPQGLVANASSHQPSSRWIDFSVEGRDLFSFDPMGRKVRIMSKNKETLDVLAHFKGKGLEMFDSAYDELRIKLESTARTEVEAALSG